jgi:hypothetical protein
VSKHLPAPWFVSESRAGVLSGYVGITTNKHDDFAQVVVQMDDDDEPLPYGHANARLIAAAPELLEALQSLLDDVGRANSMLGAVKARAAISKATGESA